MTGKDVTGCQYVAIDTKREGTDRGRGRTSTYTVKRSCMEHFMCLLTLPISSLYISSAVV